MSDCLDLGSSNAWGRHPCGVMACPLSAFIPLCMQSARVLVRSQTESVVMRRGTAPRCAGPVRLILAPCSCAMFDCGAAYTGNGHGSGCIQASDV